MADTAARLAISARRNEVARFTIAVTGIDMTGVVMAMQIRLGRDVPGAPLISLATVTTLVAEGLKLDSVTTTNGVPTSIIKGRINASTMTDATKVPYKGEIGTDSVLAYAMQWTLGGDAQTRLYGDFIVLGSAFGSDDAPTNRPPSYGGATSCSGGTSSGSLTFGDQVINVSINGVEQLAPIVAAAASFSASSGVSAAAAAGSALLSQNWAEGAGEPGGSGTKSSKAWAMASGSSAALAASSLALTQATKAALDAAVASGNPLGVIIPDANATFPTIGAAILATVPAAVKAIWTQGFYAPGDAGDGLYFRVSSDPGVGAAGFRTGDRFMPDGSTSSANGGWWKLVVQGQVYLEQLGGKADCPISNFDYTDYTASWAVPAGVFDNTQAMLDAVLIASGPIPVGNWNSIGGMARIKFASTRSGFAYYFAQSIVPSGTVFIEGNGSGNDDGPNTGTTLAFPPNVLGMLFNHRLTQPAGAPQRGTGGSRVQGIRLRGGGGTDRTAHGVRQRVPIFMDDVLIDAFAGNCHHNVATAGVPVTDNRFGLTSGTMFTNVTCRAAGNWCSYTEGGDCSASTFINFHHKSSRLGNLYDMGFFVNDYRGWQSNGHGYAGLGACQYNGRQYVLVSNQAGVGGTTTPGTNEAVWEDFGARDAPLAGRFPAWVSGNNYELSVPAYIGGQVTVTGYMEVYYLPAIVARGTGGQFYGTIQPGRRTAMVFSDVGYQDVVLTNTPQGFRRKMVLPDPVTGAQLEVLMGGTPSLGDVVIQQHSCEAMATRYTKYYTASGDVAYGVSANLVGVADTHSITGTYTTTMLGVAVPQANFLVSRRFALGDPNDSTNTRRLSMGNTAPLSGTYARGHRIIDVNPTPNGREGWRCTTAGTITSAVWAASTTYLVGSAVTNGGNTYVAVLPPVWAANTAYAVGDVRSRNGSSFVVTTAGTSGTRGPIGFGRLGTGAEVSDGTVVWSRATAAKSGSSGGPTGTGSNILDGQVYWTYQVPFVFSEYGRASLVSYTVATLPSASANPQLMVYVSNDTTGAQPAFSDGSTWRRTQDRTPVA